MPRLNRGWINAASHRSRLKALVTKGKEWLQNVRVNGATKAEEKEWLEKQPYLKLAALEYPELSKSLEVPPLVSALNGMTHNA